MDHVGRVGAGAPGGDLLLPGIVALSTFLTALQSVAFPL